MKQSGAGILVFCALVVGISAVLGWDAILQGSRTAGLVFAQQSASTPAMASSSSSNQDDQKPAGITVDYPEEGSIFPPEITPPTFLWRDASNNASFWMIDVAFSDGSAGIHAKSTGERLRIGEIDPRCVAASNEPPKLTPQQAAARTWIPDAATWESIKRHSMEHPATITWVSDREVMSCDVSLICVIICA